jgi:thermostable 8-oxoguanine DNA glycosylase
LPGAGVKNQTEKNEKNFSVFQFSGSKEDLDKILTYCFLKDKIKFLSCGMINLSGIVRYVTTLTSQ